MSYLGNNVQKTRKNSNFRTAKKRGSISRPRIYGEFDRKTIDYRRIGPDLTVIFYYCNIFLKKKFLCVPQGHISPTKKNCTRGKIILFTVPQNRKVFATNQKPNP